MKWKIKLRAFVLISYRQLKEELEYQRLKTLKLKEEAEKLQREKASESER